MEITLEKIELVKDRTGVSYREAKEALEFAEGNVVDAIIYIEDNIDASYVGKDNGKFQEFKKFITETVRKGNVNRIKIYKGEDVILNLPLTAGIAGLVLFQWWGIIVATIATGVAKCKIELVKEDGSVIDVTDKAANIYETAKDKGSVIVDEVADKASDIYSTAKDKGSEFAGMASGIYETAKDTAGEIFKKKAAPAEKEAECACEEAPCCCDAEPVAEEAPCCDATAVEEATCCCEEAPAEDCGCLKEE